MLITHPLGFEHLRTRGHARRSFVAGAHRERGRAETGGMRTACDRRLLEQTARCESTRLPKSRSLSLASLSGMYTLVHTLVWAGTRAE
jgi:hypothetical protein